MNLGWNKRSVSGAYRMEVPESCVTDDRSYTYNVRNYANGYKRYSVHIPVNLLTRIVRDYTNGVWDMQDKGHDSYVNLLNMFNSNDDEVYELAWDMLGRKRVLTYYDQYKLEELTGGRYNLNEITGESLVINTVCSTKMETSTQEDQLPTSGETAISTLVCAYQKMYSTTSSKITTWSKELSSYLLPRMQKLGHSVKQWCVEE